MFKKKSVFSAKNMTGVLFRVSSLMSFRCLLAGVLVSLRSVGLLGLWVGIELNFLGAIGYLSGISGEESESVIKYFVVQVLGSCLIVLGIIMILNFRILRLAEGAILGGVLIKLGVFPFHF